MLYKPAIMGNIVVNKIGELKRVKNGVIEMQYGERFDDTYYRNAIEGVVIEEPN